MERDLSDLYEKLRLTVDEQQEVEVGKEEVLLSVEKSKKCIAFCVISDREANKGALKSTMVKVWQVEGKAVIKDVGFNKFMIELKRIEDKERIMMGRPWSFDKQLLCLQDYENVVSIKEVPFKEEAFWIQCHEIPFAGMNKKTGNDIGSRLGKVINVDTDFSGICLGEFLRIKCEKKEQGSATGDGLEQQYGAWLRASGKRSDTNSILAGRAHVQVNKPELNLRETPTILGENQNRKEKNLQLAENLELAMVSMPNFTENIPGFQASEMTQNQVQISTISAGREVEIGPIIKENIGGMTESGPSEFSALSPQKPNQNQAQLENHLNPQTLISKKGSASGKTWRKRAREGPTSTSSKAASSEGYKEDNKTQKKKETGDSEETQLKRRRSSNDEDTDSSMAEAAEQPCLLP
ncbi:unnamed protein product [Fraxinus pennsylvanica]|uniref:DUF4283 domain-containing protein n=1 Tax=Fraxinus pennsylvanica TaxID=56036 RepID=A0AAD1ZDI4_9LAMI|nr:unnamed protein product [Fraxinus pennsylvanica]